MRKYSYDERQIWLGVFAARYNDIRSAEVACEIATEAVQAFRKLPRDYGDVGLEDIRSQSPYED